jgi:hypothetical protein
MECCFIKSKVLRLESPVGCTYVRFTGQRQSLFVAALATSMLIYRHFVRHAFALISSCIDISSLEKCQTAFAMACLGGV